MNLINSYEAGDADSLCEISTLMVKLQEYTVQNDQYVDQRAKDYLNTTYINDVVLVLSSEGKFYSYSRNRINKILRANNHHGNDETNKKFIELTLVLNSFIFEEDATVKPESEFFISWTAAIGPHMRRKTGNTDSNGIFVNEIKIGDRNVKLSVIESVVLFIAYEFWQTATGKNPVWPPGLLFVTPLIIADDLRKTWGAQIVDNIVSQKPYWESAHGKKLPESIFDHPTKSKK